MSRNRSATCVCNSEVSCHHSKRSNHCMLTASDYITSGSIRFNYIRIRSSLRHLLSQAAPHHQRQERPSHFNSCWRSESLLLLFHCDFYYPMMPGHIKGQLCYKNLIWLTVLPNNPDKTWRCLGLTLWSHFCVAWGQSSCDVHNGNVERNNANT